MEIWLVAICDYVSLLYVYIGVTHLVLSFLLGRNLLFFWILVYRTCISRFLHIFIHFVQYPLIHIVIRFLLGSGLLISGCTHICTLVYPGRSFYVTEEELCTCCVYVTFKKEFFCVDVYSSGAETAWKNWWCCLLTQVLFCVVFPSGVFNYQ